MVENNNETVDTSNHDVVGNQDGRPGEETVAPWQQVEQEPEEQSHEEEQEGAPAPVDDQVEIHEVPGDQDGMYNQDVKEQQQQQEGYGEEGQHDEQGVDINMDDLDPLAGLGSVDDIAAAAMQAAGLSGLFGDIGNSEGEVDRGTKRSHDAMTEAQEEVSVMEQFSTVEPTPVDSMTMADQEQPLAAPTNVASFQNSFAQFQSEPASVPSSSSALQSNVISAPLEVKATEEPVTTADVEGNNPADIAANTTESDATAAPIEDGGVPGLPLIGFQDLQAVAQAAMGLDANGNPLPGNEESHRALAEAVKRLSAAQGITLPNLNGSNDDDGSKEDSRGSQDGGPVKRFQCTQCERAFARAYNLNTHLATHDPDPARSKPFPCPYPSCKTDGGRSFSRKHDLQRHVASTHENEPEPGINGTGDENGARQTGGLASLGLGTPGRKFRCDECGRAFVRRDALKRHQCTKVMETSNTPPRRLDAPDYYSNPVAGLSLYTSNPGGPSQRTGQQQTASNGAASAAGSSYDSDPFGPNGITYENLSKEVQDMAMQLVAQAQSYNEQKTKPSQNEQQQPKASAIAEQPSNLAPTPTPTPAPVPASQATPSVQSIPAPPAVQQTQSTAPSQTTQSTISSQVSEPITSAQESIPSAQESQPGQEPQPPPTKEKETESDEAKATVVVKTESLSEPQDKEETATATVSTSTAEATTATPVTVPSATSAAPSSTTTVKVEEGSPPFYPDNTTNNASNSTPSLVSAQ